MNGQTGGGLSTQWNPNGPR